MTNAEAAVPVLVIPAFGTVEIAEWVQHAIVAARPGHCLVVAGIVRIPSRERRQRGGWQFSLSHWGRPPVPVSMHALKRDAEAQVARVQLMSRTRDLGDDGVFAALIQALAAFGDGVEA